MSFATIHFADGKEELLNTNCKNINFLQAVRVKCAEVCSAADLIDVADETGECKFLYKNLDSYTSQYVGERERLILLRVEDPKPGEKLLYNVRFIPLLKSLEDDKEFILAINPTSSQRSKTNKITAKAIGKKANLTATASVNGPSAENKAPSTTSTTPAAGGGGGKRSSVNK